MTLFPNQRLNLQASLSTKAETVEDLQGRRKTLHMGMTKLAKEDLHRQLVNVEERYKVRSRSAAEGTAWGQ